MIRFSAPLALCATLAGGQSFDGPVSAWYLQPTGRSLIVIAGYPGAATLGSILLQDVDAGAVAPGCRQALVRRGDVWSLYPHKLETPLIAAERAAWSADGETAYLAGNGQFQRIRQGQVSPAQPLPAGRLRALAVSGNGKSAALLVEGVLYRVSEQNELQTGHPVDAQALAFAGNSLYAAEAGRIVRLTENGGTEPVAELAGALGLSADSAGRLMIITASEVALLDQGQLERKPSDTPVTGWQTGCQADHLLLESGGDVSLFRSGRNAGIFFVPRPVNKEEN